MQIQIRLKKNGSDFRRWQAVEPFQTVEVPDDTVAFRYANTVSELEGAGEFSWNEVGSNDFHVNSVNPPYLHNMAA